MSSAQQALKQSTQSKQSMPFTWASVAKGGNKECLSETIARQEAEKAALKKTKEEKARILKEQENERVLRESLIQAGKEQEFLIKKAEQEKEAAAIAERYSKKNGYYWTNANFNFDVKYLEVPKNVSERALKYTEEFITNFPEVSACKTISEFKTAYMAALIPYIHVKYYNSKYDRGFSAFEYWLEKNNTSEIKKNTPTTPLEEYTNLQRWVQARETEWQRLSERDKSNNPHLQPWSNNLWVFAKNVTFEKCLWTLDMRSKTFAISGGVRNEDETTYVWGLIQISDQNITWLVPELENYHFYPHKNKPECKKKTEQRQKRMDEWDL